MTRGDVHRRLAGPADAEFRTELLTDDARARLAGLPGGVREQMVELQVRARTAHEAALGPEAVDWVILADPGALAVGRLLVSDDGDTWHIIDFRLLRHRRGMGIGHACLAGLVADADRVGRRVTLTVAADSPAQRLYARLGFASTARCSTVDGGADLTMERVHRPCHVDPPQLAAALPVTRAHAVPVPCPPHVVPGGQGTGSITGSR